MVYGAMGCGVAVGSGMGVVGIAVLSAVGVGELVTVMITVTATPDLAAGVAVAKVLADDVVGTVGTAVSQLISKTRVKNNPAIR